MEPGPRPSHLTAGEWQAIHAALAGTAGLLLGRALLGRTGGLAAGVVAFAAGLLAKRAPVLPVSGGSGPGPGGQRISVDAPTGNAGDGFEIKTAPPGAEEVQEVQEVLPGGADAAVVVDAAAYAEQPAFFLPVPPVETASLNRPENSGDPTPEKPVEAPQSPAMTPGGAAAGSPENSRAGGAEMPGRCGDFLIIATEPETPAPAVCAEPARIPEPPVSVPSAVPLRMPPTAFAAPPPLEAVAGENIPAPEDIWRQAAAESPSGQSGLMVQALAAPPPGGEAEPPLPVRTEAPVPPALTVSVTEDAPQPVPPVAPHPVISGGEMAAAAIRTAPEKPAGRERSPRPVSRGWFSSPGRIGGLFLAGLMAAGGIVAVLRLQPGWDVFREEAPAAPAEKAYASDGFPVLTAPSPPAAGESAPSPAQPVPPASPAESPPPPAGSPEPVIPAPAASAATPEAEEARNVVARLLEAKTPVEVQPWIFDGESAGPQLEAYFRSGRAVPVVSCDIVPIQASPRSDGRMNWLFRVITDTAPEGFPVAVEETPEGLRTNWEMLIQCRDRALMTFAGDQAARPARFYVILSRRHIFDDLLPEKDQPNFYAFNLTSPASEKTPVTALVRKGTPLGDQVESLYEFGNTYAHVVELSHWNGRMEITALIRQQWR